MLEKKDLKIEYLCGQGPGGQRKNKRETACRITHLPTGVQAYADTRTQENSYREAMKDLEAKLKQAKEDARAADRKARRDEKIHDHTVVRTYSFHRGQVKDHRTGKTASVKDVVEKGKLDLLR